MTIVQISNILKKLPLIYFIFYFVFNLQPLMGEQSAAKSPCGAIAMVRAIILMPKVYSLKKLLTYKS